MLYLTFQIYHGTRHSDTHQQNQSWVQNCKGHEEISIIRFETENIYLMILVYSSIIKCFVKILQMEDYGNANEMFKLLHKKKRKSA